MYITNVLLHRLLHRSSNINEKACCHVIDKIRLTKSSLSPTQETSKHFRLKIDNTKTSLNKYALILKFESKFEIFANNATSKLKKL